MFPRNKLYNRTPAQKISKYFSVATKRRSYCYDYDGLPSSSQRSFVTKTQQSSLSQQKQPLGVVPIHDRYHHASNGASCNHRRPLYPSSSSATRCYASSTNPPPPPNKDGEGHISSVSSSSDTTTTSDEGRHDVVIPGSQTGGKKLAIIFTCTVCDTRSAKQFTENAYQNGVVIVQCPGCQNRHLIADNLGFFDDQEDGGWNIEKAMSKRNNENVKVITHDNVFEISVEDIYGKDAITKAIIDATKNTVTEKEDGDDSNNKNNQ